MAEKDLTRWRWPTSARRHDPWIALTSVQRQKLVICKMGAEFLGIHITPDSPQSAQGSEVKPATYHFDQSECSGLPVLPFDEPLPRSLSSPSAEDRHRRPGRRSLTGRKGGGRPRDGEEPVRAGWSWVAAVLTPISKDLWRLRDDGAEETRGGRSGVPII
ncbi:uncharacterized protein B0I36DRAFT_348809 [Microdochium trichocladiopsis]|uniref:Uncharacterized protein n=1 Tax=Microdochium trichocladiopsis TaxID=1682393 RepID=A0A9P9BMV1_9PEZI|nr:uncharacterized protein B0I36DRAFT_348809 [Microdochium trichocladiopsis]KAH7030601.1 hypothetical protein B0I36DRAFT_348809 [Microdochium trichocladiopsis]